MLFVLSTLASILLGVSVVSGLIKGGEMSIFSGGCLVVFLFLIMVIVVFAGLFAVIGMFE